MIAKELETMDKNNKRKNWEKTVGQSEPDMSYRTPKKTTKRTARKSKR